MVCDLEERSRQNPKPLAPRSWNFSLQNCEQETFAVYKPPSLRRFVRAAGWPWTAGQPQLNPAGRAGGPGGQGLTQPEHRCLEKRQFPFSERLFSAQLHIQGFVPAWSHLTHSSITYHYARFTTEEAEAQGRRLARSGSPGAQGAERDSRLPAPPWSPALPSTGLY